MEPEENGVRNQTEERLKEEQITTKRNKREMIFLFLPTFFGKEEAKKFGTIMSKAKATRSSLKSDNQILFKQSF